MGCGMSETGVGVFIGVGDEIWNFLEFFSNFLELQRIHQRLVDVDESQRATSASRCRRHYRPRYRSPCHRAAPLPPASRRQRGRERGDTARYRPATDPSPGTLDSPRSRPAPVDRGAVSPPVITSLRRHVLKPCPSQTVMFLHASMTV